MSTDGELTMLEKLTAVLSDGDWHSTAELVEKVGHRFSATMHTAIRKQGYKIEKRRNSRKQFEYQMQTAVKVATQNY